MTKFKRWLLALAAAAIPVVGMAEAASAAAPEPERIVVAPERVLSTSMTCYSGKVNVYLRIAANQRIYNGGQLVAQQFYLKSVYSTASITTPWSGAAFVSANGTPEYRVTLSVPRNWVYVDVYVLLRYWTGTTWLYDTAWSRINGGGYSCEIGWNGISG